jgi:adenylate cyclase
MNAESSIHGAEAGVVGTAIRSQGTEAPDDMADEQPFVQRSFSFVDLCGFTRFVSDHGERAAIDTLQSFRALTREVAVRRDVLINKWLGDGALIVGSRIGPTISAVAELVARYEREPLALRGGIAHGEALVIDGDDYVGRATNLAARLCGAAGPGELLAVNISADLLPGWIQVRSTRPMTLPGIGHVARVQQLGLAQHVAL